MFDDLIASGVTPITQHFVTFLVGASEAMLSSQQIHQAFATAMAFCKASGGDCSIYSALLKLCVSQGVPEKTVDVWRQIRKASAIKCIIIMLCPTEKGSFRLGMLFL